MNPPKKTPSPAITPSIRLEDIYYVLFRHKWLIISLSSVAIIAATLVRMLAPVTYESEAKLMIKYVTDPHLSDVIGATAQRSGDMQGDVTVNNEMEVIASKDLASNVVEMVGASNILAKAGGGTNKFLAAMVVNRGLRVLPTRDQVITLTFTHPDPEITQTVLAQLIDAYFKKHEQVHHFDYSSTLTKELDAANAKIASSEKELHQIESENGIFSEGQTEQSYTQVATKLLDEKLQVESDLAAQTQIIKEMEAAYGAHAAAVSNALASASATNSIATNKAAPVAAKPADIPADKLADYRAICKMLVDLRVERDRLRGIYTEQNPMVKVNATLITTNETMKQDMEAKYPMLIAEHVPDHPTQVASADNGSNYRAGPDPRTILLETRIRADSLKSKLNTLSNQLASIQQTTAAMSGVSDKISQLKRDRDDAVQHVQFLNKQLQQMSVYNTLAPGASNIGQVESPTPPSKNIMEVNRLFMGILFGGLALAFGIPFLIEFVLDRTFKRASEVQARIHLPFFISIPFSAYPKQDRKALKQAKAAALLTNGEQKPAEANGEPIPGVPAMASIGQLPAVWETSNGLYPYYETLRDRLMTYFDMINLTHKPKLVAVTSCAVGAGVTTTAAGLASSLSETGDGNVLLVNMNARDGEAHHFYKGKLADGLDAVLEKGAKGGSPLNGNNLFMAKEEAEDERLPRVLPKRFNHLLPKMKASDFDYIIFDMPPVNQISITPRLARFMDMVLLVVESEKTNRDVAKNVADMLAGTKTNVGVILNKSRSYLPRRLQEEV